MQCIKKGSTLRVSPKRQKPTPRIVYRYGKEDSQIKEFLAYRRRIRRMIRELERKHVPASFEEISERRSNPIHIMKRQNQKSARAILLFDEFDCQQSYK